jgi:glyoxylase-like metal-dependent hydrolase (beta-lactamase superfamily II)
MKLSSLHISNFKVDGGAMFGVIPKGLWSRRYSSDENNMINISLRSLIIDTGDRIVLVDNGYGDKQDEKFFRHVYLNGGDGLLTGLEKAGYASGDITDVLLTHLHADHCGGGVKWNSDRTGYELTFPNADYLVSKEQWEWALAGNVREAGSYPQENLLPMRESGRLKFAAEGELIPGISLRVVNGHTPGQLIPVIDYNGTVIVFAADLIPTVAHIPLIWNMSYDLDQLATISEKESLLREAVDNGYVLFFEHDPEIECCTLKHTPGGIREDRIFKLHDL